MRIKRIRPEMNAEAFSKVEGIPLGLLRLLREVAIEVGITRIALVGGVVRDFLLRDQEVNFNQSTKDIDLVVEGSATKLAARLSEFVDTNRLKCCKVHESYDTVELSIDGFVIDLATSRAETYSYPGSNPKVKACHIEKDLKRRDFTINAIALELNTWEIIDPHNGLNDLQLKELRFLHSKSVVDDPTRVIRGARYAARLNLRLSDKSLLQVRSAIQKWPWNSQAKQPPALSTRLRMELELLFDNEPWMEAIALLQTWGALSLLDKNLQVDKTLVRRILWASRLQISRLTALTLGASNPLALAKRLQLAQQQQNLIQESTRLQTFLNSSEVKEHNKEWAPSEWCQALEKGSWGVDSVALTICLGKQHWPKLLHWWGKWRHITSPISANSLLEQGWEAGPQLGQELERLRFIEIDSKN